MDSDSVGDRQDEMFSDFSQLTSDDSDAENEEIAMEQEDPKILSPEIRDVFHVFANMLDIKSFMKLAMTCKDTYKRCKEDNRIKINVKEDYLIVYHDGETIVFEMDSITVHYHHTDNFHDALPKLPCRVKLQSVAFNASGKTGPSIVAETHRFLKEIGVEAIEKLMFMDEFTECEKIIPFIKSFRVDEVDIVTTLPRPILRSLLSLDIKKLSYCKYEDEVPVDILLENDSTIPEIYFHFITRIDKDQLMKILSKIQSGPLHHLRVHFEAVNWNDYEKIPFDHDGPLPDERPLLIAKTTGNIDEYWFLHWQGDVTKCVVNNNALCTLEIFKCEPWEHPWILRDEHDVMKALFEKRPRVSCTAAQYKVLFSTMEKLATVSYGDLPEKRPLYFPGDEISFWILNEDDSMKICVWEDGCVTWTDYSYYGNIIGNLPSDRYFFIKLLKEGTINGNKTVHCVDLEDIDIWLGDFLMLDFDYPFPLSARRVVFETSKDINLRVILFEGGVFECRSSGEHVYIKRCLPWDRPPSLITAEVVKEILQNTLRKLEERWFRGYVPPNLNIRIAHKTFCEGFDQFKKSPGPFRTRVRPVIYEKTTTSSDGEKVDERWYCDDLENIRKAVWKDGIFVASSEQFLTSPVEFRSRVFRMLAEEEDGNDPLHLDYGQFRNCLDQFTIVPFDYSGSLKSDSPMAFVKKEIRHSSHRKEAHGTSDFFVARVWFLWDGSRMTKCSWEEEEKGPGKVSFEGSSDFQEMPPMLSSKEYLKSLIKGDYDDASRFEWFGRLSDLRILLDDYKKLPHDYKGPLPNERPLVLETEDESVCLLLREDGTVIKCDSRQ